MSEPNQFKINWPDLTADSIPQYIESDIMSQIRTSYSKPEGRMEYKDLTMRSRARSAAGQLDRIPNCNGYWVHVQVSASGVPKSATIIYREDDAWCQVRDGGHTEMRPVDKLPNGGMYIFLYGE